MTRPDDLTPEDPYAPSGATPTPGWAQQGGWPNADPQWGAVPTVATRAPERRRPGGIVAVAVLVVAVLIGGAGTVAALTGQEANTPDAAVRGLLGSAANADVLGVMDHIDPAERDSLAGFLANGNKDLQRLGVLSRSTDLHRVTGLNASFTGLTTTTTTLRPGISAVQVTGGSVHGHVDPAQLPLGPFVHKVAGSSLDKLTVQDRTTPLRTSSPIVTVRRSGTWYVSIGYTVAELARAKVKAALPREQDAVPARGASSPTAAVDDFLHATAGLDVRRLIELTPPDEMAALHDYAPLFLPKVTDEISKLQAGDHQVRVTITALSLSSHVHPGGQLVTVNRIGVRASFGGTNVELAPGARCLTVSGTTESSFPGACGPTGVATALPATLAGGFKTLANLRPDTGIATVERDHRWYVSPTRTTLDDTEAVLHALTPDILQSLESVFSPSSLLGGISTVRPGLSSPEPASSGTEGVSGSISRQSVSTCVSGRRTIIVPQRPGQPTRPPVVVPCRTAGG